MVIDRCCCLSVLVGAALLVVCFVPGCETNSERASAAIKKGNDLLNQREVDASIAAYTKAIRLDPKNPQAYICRACAYEAKADFDKAIVDETAAIRLDPKSPSGYRNRGFTYLKMKESDLAITDFTAALHLKLNEAEAKHEYSADHFGRARAYDGQGEFDKAIADYTEAIRLYKQVRPHNPKYIAMYYFDRGVAYDKKGDKTKAEDDFARAKLIDPEMARLIREWKTMEKIEREQKRRDSIRRSG